VEIITPDEQFLTKVLEIKDKDDCNCEVANTNDEARIRFVQAPKNYKYALARTPGVVFINKKAKE